MQSLQKRNQIGERLSPDILRRFMNIWPCFRGTGGRITYISSDFHEMHVKIPLNWRTRNYVGTIFGGSMYGSVDPHYMLMFMRILGKEFVIWDKAAQIRFLKPASSDLTARFVITPEEIEDVRKSVMHGPCDRDYTVELVDSAGKVCAIVTKTLYFATHKDYLNRKRPPN